MKYLIAYVLSDEAATAHRKLSRQLSEQFGTADPALRIPPHLTLKAPFEVEDITPVCEMLLQFVKSVEVGKFELGGFGHFDRRVIYVHAHADIATRGALVSLTSLLEVLHLPMEQFDSQNRTLHATLARTSEDNFLSLWKFLQEEQFFYSVLFDQLVLMRKDKDMWQVEEVFEILQ
jgi:2'-5' RNA ligase